MINATFVAIEALLKSDGTITSVIFGKAWHGMAWRGNLKPKK